MARKNMPASGEGTGPKKARRSGGSRPLPPPCFVVAIGASAGGQEALEQLFTVIPVDCGLSFLVVMHLPPTGPSFLAEMLARYTGMPVVTAEDDMPLLPNRIQVIPAGRDMVIEEGRLRLRVPDGTLHPVDRLFRSMAAEPAFRKVAVVLSGSGSDGAAGARSIRDAQGVVLVQDPDSALFPGMPESVIALGAADLILPPAEIPLRISELARGSCSLLPPACQPVSIDEELAAICAIVKQKTGHDYSSYKAATVLRRVERRMAVHEMGGIGKYVDLLKESPHEAHALGQDILIGVTGFFRDPDAFAVLRRTVIPRLFAGREPEEPVRVWHACCATGEEVYSMAILMREFMEEQRPDARVQMFATDIDETSIAQARTGLYPADIEGEVGEERLRKYFSMINGRHYQVAKQLREMVIFAHHSLVKDPPFSRLDLIVCRNFLIYLNSDMQKRLIALFHQVLKPGGYLFLGAAETVGRQSDLFATIDKKWRIYQRQETGRRVDVQFPFAAMVPRLPGAIRPTRSAGSIVPPPGSYAEKFLVERYAPPCVVVNEQYEVVYFSDRTSRFLTPPVGEPTLDVIRMAREELRPSLRAAIHKAFADQKKVVFRGVKLSGEGDEGTVTIQVEPIGTPSPAVRLASVVFEPVPVAAPGLPAPAGEECPAGSEPSQETLVRLLEENLRIAREQLQATIEQLETSNDGFMSTNEELITINEEYQATNEELQATNEELETSKEELQALNEELSTVNVELQGVVEEVKQANADLENLFASSEIATAFLDRRLTIKRFSPPMARIFNLIPADIGRPFRHLRGTIDWSDLPGDAAAVLDTLVPLEREVTALADGRHYLMRVLPYRNAAGVVDGVVVTLIDITVHKRAEEQIRNAALFPEENPFPVLRLGGDGVLLFANRSSAALLEDWQCSLGDAAPELVRRELTTALECGVSRELEIRCGERDLSFMLVPIPERGYVNFYGRDITDRKHAEDALRRARDEWERTFDSVPDLIAIMDDKHRVVRANRAMAERMGLTSQECEGKACYLAVHGADQPPHVCPHALTLTDGREHQAEIHEERLGGDFLVTTTPLLDDQGAMIGTVHVARDITERKRAEEALRESEERVRRKLDSILVPEGGTGELELADIVDARSLQSLVEDFYKLTRMPMALIDITGKVLVGVGWQEICTRFHRVNPETCRNCVESDIQLSAGVPPGEYKIYKCMNNLWDVATPVMVGEKHLGNLFMGQFFFEDETLDYDLFRSQARQYDFDEADYIACLDAVPRLTREALDTSMAFFMKLADILSKLGYSNLKLARSVAEGEALTDSLGETSLRLDLLAETASRLLMSDAPQEVVESLCRKVMAFLGCHVFFNFLANEEKGRLHLNACAGIPEEESKKIEWLDYGVAVCGCAARDACRIVAEDIPNTPDPRTELVKTFGIQAYACHPLLSQGRVLGTLSFGTRTRSSFTDDELALMKAVADQVAIALERKHAAESLRASELFYRQTLESIPGMVFTTRPDGYCDYQSQQWVDFTGIPMSEHMGDGWNRLLHPDDRPRAYAAWQAAVEGRSPYDLEYRVRRHDGVYEWFKVVGRPIRDVEGRIVRWFGVALNIEDIKKSEEALHKAHAGLEERVEERTIELASALNTLHEEIAVRIRATEELREKERMLMHQSRQAAMGEMIGNIAHQWRQPLNALGLSIQQLELAYECGSLDKAQFDGNIAKAMEIIFHMSQTIDDFRNFYRPDKEKTWFKIGQLLERTISLVEVSFRADRISIEIDGGEEADIHGYPNEYAQALLNILMNARDAFLERKAGEPRIVIRHRPEGSRSVVTVTDNAGGIPAEILGKIFDPYFTTKEQGIGTGVGLFMSKTIIEKNMGGRLTAANVDGGAEFRIEV